MLLVKTFLAPDAFGGMGLFAKESVKRGAPIWVYHPAADTFFTWSQFLALPALQRDLIGRHIYPATRDGEYGVMYSHDNDRYTNHSITANTGMREGYNPDNTMEEPMIALRDIAEGDELTTNYLDFVQPDFAERYMKLPSFGFFTQAR